MVAGPGIERNHGVFGFDWVTHARSVEPADSDMRQIIVDGPNALTDRFLLVEALSGWDKDDVLRGDDEVPSLPNTEVNVAGLTNELDAAGIIIIGGSGSDQIWGNGADDIIDGDKWLNVRLSVLDAPGGSEIRTVASLTELQADIMSRTIDPGNVTIVREILSSPGANDVDAAVFSGAMAEYDVTTVNGVTTVAHTRGTGNDVTDRITNVERLRFSDQTVNVVPVEVQAPAVPVIGTATAGDTTATRRRSGLRSRSTVTRWRPSSSGWATRRQANSGTKAARYQARADPVLDRFQRPGQLPRFWELLRPCRPLSRVDASISVKIDKSRVRWAVRVTAVSPRS